MGLSSTSYDSVTVMWTISAETVVDSYELLWKIKRGDRKEFSVAYEDKVANSTNKYNITGLGEFENATIEVLVKVVNEAGNNTSLPLILHSDTLQRCLADPQTGNRNNISAFVGGGIGIFLFSFVSGFLMACVILRLCC